MILLWGVPGDSPLAAVREALEEQGAGAAFLDQHLAPETEIDLSIDSSLEGELRCRSLRISFASITAAYIRPYDSRRILELAKTYPGSGVRDQALELEDALVSWAELSPGLVINRPSAMASNNSKPYQGQLIRSLDFEVPETLVTTDPQAVLEFLEQCGSVVYKSVSGIRSIVSRLSQDRLDDLKDVAHCPTQFQEYISGADYRVHVVADEVYACEIVSAADDYRYGFSQGAAVEIRPARLSTALEDRCRHLATQLGLAVAGIDLRRTHDDHWYCFEVNPSPGFTYYEEATGQPIADAVARLLMSSDRRDA